MKVFKLKDSDGNNFTIVAESSADAVFKARKKTTAKTIYLC